MTNWGSSAAKKRRKRLNGKRIERQLLHVQDIIRAKRAKRLRDNLNKQI